MHELLTQPKTPEIPRQVAGIKSEWWPASNRNGGRHQIGIFEGSTRSHRGTRVLTPGCGTSLKPD
jgi:hypothetical protein